MKENTVVNKISASIILNTIYIIILLRPLFWSTSNKIKDKIKTAQAKNKIRAFFKKQDKEEYLKKGEEIELKIDVNGFAEINKD